MLNPLLDTPVIPAMIFQSSAPEFEWVRNNAGNPFAAVLTVINDASILSSSAQIASDISGSFIVASGSFSTRVTANDAKTGISTAQANAITANTAKVSSPFPTITTKQENATITIASLQHIPAASDDAKDTLAITVQIIVGKTKTLKTFTLTAD